MNNKILSIAIVAGLASVAAADIVSLEFDGVSRGRNTGIDQNGSGFYNVFAGSVIHNVEGVRTVTYCIDPDQWAQTATANFERDTLEGAFVNRTDSQAKAWAVAELADIAGPSIWTESVDRDLAAAFQIAIWEIVLDYDSVLGGSSLDLGDGDFRAAGTGGSSISSSIMGYYDDLLGAMSFGQTSTAGYEAYTNSASQDFFTQIPTPGTAVLGLLALPMVATRRRR